jgi:hypothetical protein
VFSVRKVHWTRICNLNSSFLGVFGVLVYTRRVGVSFSLHRGRNPGYARVCEVTLTGLNKFLLIVLD